MIFLKFIISTIFKRAYIRAQKQSVYPEDSVKFRFGLRLSFYISLFVFIIYRISANVFGLNIETSVNCVLIIALLFIVIFGILLSLTLNFELIKNIELTTKQKNCSRIILLVLVLLLIFLYP